MSAKGLPSWLYVYREDEELYAYEKPIDCCDKDKVTLVGAYELKEKYHLSLRVVQQSAKTPGKGKK